MKLGRYARPSYNTKLIGKLQGSVQLNFKLNIVSEAFTLTPLLKMG